MSENSQKTTSLTKAANQDTAISDFRKSSRSFGIIAKGIAVEDTEKVCSAVMFDLLAGKLDLGQTAALFKGVDLMLKREDQHLQREEMALQAELRKMTGKRLKARRELLER